MINDLTPEEEAEYEELLDYHEHQYALFKEAFVENYEKEWGIACFMPKLERNKKRLVILRKGQAKIPQDYFQKVRKVVEQTLKENLEYLGDPDMMDQFGWKGMLL